MLLKRQYLVTAMGPPPCSWRPSLAWAHRKFSLRAKRHPRARAGQLTHISICMPSMSEATDDSHMFCRHENNEREP